MAAEAWRNGFVDKVASGFSSLLLSLHATQFSTPGLF